MPQYGPIPESKLDVRIVGVIRSERTAPLQEPLEVVAYVPLAQAPQQDIKLVVRTRGEPLAAMSGIREAVRQVDPNLPLGDVMTMERVKERSMLWAVQPTWVVGAFAGVAALLASLGLYGVLAYAVTQQRREIGIRMALGARPGKVLSGVLRSASSMLIVGLGGGLVGAFALTRVTKSILFDVSPLFPAALAVACVAMTLVGLLAAWIPANGQPGWNLLRCSATKADWESQAARRATLLSYDASIPSRSCSPITRMPSFSAFPSFEPDPRPQSRSSYCGSPSPPLSRRRLRSSTWPPRGSAWAACRSARNSSQPACRRARPPSRN